jgi:hypothetical protein
MKKRITRSGACSTMPFGKYILFNIYSPFLYFFVLCLFWFLFFKVAMMQKQFTNLCLGIQKYIIIENTSSITLHNRQNGLYIS